MRPLEYAQARGFVLDPAESGILEDKGRVEHARSSTFRPPLFAGEAFATLAQAQEAAERWCRVTAGERLHGTTRQRPAEHFAREERSLLLPASPRPLTRWPAGARCGCSAITTWSWPRLCTRCRRSTSASWSRVRNGHDLVRIYHRGQLIKTHPRGGPGQRSTIHGLSTRRARTGLPRSEDPAGAGPAAGPALGAYAERLLAAPQPWSRMRHVYRLLGLVRRYSAAPVEQACARALEADVVDVKRVARMVEQAVEQSPLPDRPPYGQAAAPPLRFLRQPSEYRLARGRDHE